MRLVLDVVPGAGLLWNGVQVGLSEAQRRRCALLSSGAVVQAECHYVQGSLHLVPGAELKVVREGDANLESQLALMLERGLYKELLERTTDVPPSASVHAFRARALLECHRNLARLAEDGLETEFKTRGAQELAASLALSGPEVGLDAPHSPWGSWRLLDEAERRRAGQALVQAVVRWVWRSVGRTPPHSLGDFLPPGLGALLERVPRDAWPAVPWNAWGISPSTWDVRELARRLAPSLLPLAARKDRAEAQELLELIAAGSPAQLHAVPRLGRGIIGELRRLARLSVDPGKLDLSALVSRLMGAASDEQLVEFFERADSALCVAEFAALLPRAHRKRISEVERVVFRGSIARNTNPDVVIARLRSGLFLALTEVRRGKRVLREVTEGEVRDVAAAVPEALFELAVHAVNAVA